MTWMKIALLLLFCSCSHNDPWTTNKQFGSSKLSYSPADNLRGLSLEIFQLEGKIHSYFQITSHTINSYEGNPKQALLTFIIGETSYSDVVPRHEGGQRISLSEKMQEILISSLKKNQSVTVRVGGFETIITAGKFADHYNGLKRAPIKKLFKL